MSRRFLRAYYKPLGVLDQIGGPCYEVVEDLSVGGAFNLKVFKPYGLQLGRDMNGPITIAPVDPTRPIIMAVKMHGSARFFVRLDSHLSLDNRQGMQVTDEVDG